MAKTAIAIGAVTAALASGVSAERQDSAARKSRNMTRTANQQAQNAAMKQNQLAEEQIARADKKTPDLAALLADQQQLRGPSTMLTGPSGLPANSMLGM